MKTDDFIGHKEIRSLIESARTEIASREFSDIVDGEGNQYVDLVMEGGGVLGIALLGFTFALEEYGIRFLGIGGTSAGSINALLLASLGKRDEKRSLKAIDLLANLDLYSFVDGDEDARDFIDALVNDAGTIKLGFKFLQVIDNFQEKLGLCPGTAFQDWLTQALDKHGIQNTQQLIDLMKQVPSGFRHRAGHELSPDQQEADLAIIAAEISTETKVQFPKMAELFWEDVSKISPALYARASMSIPYFFQPYSVPHIPQTPAHIAKWREAEFANYEGKIPTRCTFVDGGIMSNFPIDVFHKPYAVPSAPTFGVKLGVDRSEPYRVDSPVSLGIGIFNSARHTLDYDFIKRNPDYKHLVSTINTGKHNWIDFRLSDRAKIDLFARGANCAISFLKGFDWAKYKSIRKDLMRAYQQSDRKK